MSRLMAKLYKHVLDEATKVSRVPSIVFDPIHGGGGTTGRVFDSEIKKSRIVVCIADHDRLAPMDKKSSTARTVLKIYSKRNRGENDRGQRFIGIAVTTMGREAENMIPYHIFKSIYPDYQDFDKLDEVVARDDEEGEIRNCFWQYFDVKEGIDGKKIMKKVAAEKVSEDTVYWIGDKLGCAREHIGRVAIRGFGGNAIERFLENPDAVKRFRAFTRTGCWKDRFSKYFDGLLWFFSAPSRSRT